MSLQFTKSSLFRSVLFIAGESLLIFGSALILQLLLHSADGSSNASVLMPLIPGFGSLALAAMTWRFFNQKLSVTDFLRPKVITQPLISAFPPLWNVLKCNMSLVGPCPIGPQQANDICHELSIFDERFTVRNFLAGNTS